MQGRLKYYNDSATRDIKIYIQRLKKYHIRGGNVKVTLYMAMTVNGYVAKENDETPWSDEEWESYSKSCGSSRTWLLEGEPMKL